MRWQGLVCLVLALAAVGGGCGKRRPPASRAPNRSGPGWESLHAAAREGNIEAARLLITQGAKINAQDDKGFTPLHVAVREDREPVLKVGEKSIVQLLLAAGADVNAQDKKGATPLHHAAFLRRMRAAKQLLAGAADVNIRDMRGETALHKAVKSDSRELIERLIAAGAEVNAADKDGWTPLHIAAFHRCQEALDLLKAHGADPEKRTGEGKTANDLIREAAGANALVLSEDTERPYAVIVTDPGATAQFLRAHAMDYDHVWIPARADVEWTQGALKAALDAGSAVPTSSWFERDYVVAHLLEYNQEYSGFIANGKKFVICNMYVGRATRNMYLSRATDNGFTYVADGGGAAVRALFDLGARTVTWMECNGM
jgi:ankyrin repeat protein